MLVISLRKHSMWMWIGAFQIVGSTASHTVGSWDTQLSRDILVGKGRGQIQSSKFCKEFCPRCGQWNKNAQCKSTHSSEKMPISFPKRWNYSSSRHALQEPPGWLFFLFAQVHSKVTSMQPQESDCPEFKCGLLHLRLWPARYACQLGFWFLLIQRG